jgi:hypothetical protein
MVLAHPDGLASLTFTPYVFTGLPHTFQARGRSLMDASTIPVLLIDCPLAGQIPM